MFLFVILFLIILDLPEAFCSTGVFYQLNVETAFTDPYPVEPGNSLVLSLTLSNDGNTDVTNIIMELETTEPFILLESSKKDINVVFNGVNVFPLIPLGSFGEHQFRS